MSIEDVNEYMKKYPKFEDYNKTQKKYEFYRNKNELYRLNERRFEKELNVKYKYFKVKEYPEGWEFLFEECKDELNRALEEVNKSIEEGYQVFPKPENLLKVFELVKPKDIKVIIIGQDPYHSVGQDSEPIAHGLSFSCLGDKPQPSLKVIFDEIERCYKDRPSSNNLKPWVEQGVLMINTAFTVIRSQPESHLRIWKNFTIKLLNLLIEYLSGRIKAKPEKRCLFVCVWGAKAKMLFDGLTERRNTAVNKITLPKNVTPLIAGHPSPSNTSVPFVGCNHFKIINKQLKLMGNKEIQWLF